MKAFIFIDKIGPNFRALQNAHALWCRGGISVNFEIQFSAYTHLLNYKQIIKIFVFNL